MTDEAVPTLEPGGAVVAAIEAEMRLHSELAGRLGYAAAVSHIAGGHLWRRAPAPRRHRLPPMEETHLMQVAATGRRWRRTSQIACLLDPTLTEELANATTDAMPTDILTYLPYHDPLIAFSTPIPCRTSDDRPARLLGFFVYGFRDIDDTDGQLCSTHDNPTHLGIMTVLDSLDGSGPEINRFPIPLESRRLVVDEFIDTTALAYAVDVQTAIAATEETVRTCLKQILRPVLSTLLYLCSKEPDLRELPTRVTASGSTATGRVSRRRRNSARFVAVGWRVGAALRRLRHRTAPDPKPSSTGTGTGRTHPPRQRAGHFKVVWTGTNRAIPRSVFVLPYWIHRDLLGLDDTESTLVPTTPPRATR